MKQIFILFLLVFLIVIYNSCSKSDSTPTPADPCSGVTVTVTGTTTNAASGQSNGSITASATGGSGFTFSLISGFYQSSGTFTGLTAGTYTVVAKNSNGCTGSTQFTVGTTTGNGACVGQPGPLFTAVKNLIQTVCTGCHNNAQTEGGMNFTVDCNIVTNKDRIKARAVDGNPSPMPPPPNAPLSAADKKKITDWLAAGGTITN
jgi:hypothetical protein